MDAAAIKSSWPQISAAGAKIGMDMFVKYFTDNPAMMAVFGYSGSPESLRSNAKLQGHAKKIMDQIGIAVSEIDDAGKMAGTLKALGVRHKNFGEAGGVKAEHFPALGVALVHAMKANVSGLNEGAWSAAYKAISDAIISGLQS